MSNSACTWHVCYYRNLYDTMLRPAPYSYHLGKLGIACSHPHLIPADEQNRRRLCWQNCCPVSSSCSSSFASLPQWSILLLLMRLRKIRSEPLIFRYLSNLFDMIEDGPAESLELSAERTLDEYTGYWTRSSHRCMSGDYLS